MSVELPNRDTVLTAIDIYLARAYPGAIPVVVQGRVEQFRSAGENWCACKAIERKSNGQNTALALRLGNPFYPHMKLMIDRRPDDLGYLFRADTHDSAITLSPDSKEYAAFTELIRRNQELASAIEADWEGAGLPILKTCLKDEVARRAALQGQNAGQLVRCGGPS
jgi:hypothetical protein